MLPSPFPVFLPPQLLLSPPPLPPLPPLPPRFPLPPPFLKSLRAEGESVSLGLNGLEGASPDPLVDSDAARFEAAVLGAGPSSVRGRFDGVAESPVGAAASRLLEDILRAPLIVC